MAWLHYDPYWINLDNVTLVEDLLDTHDPRILIYAGSGEHIIRSPYAEQLLNQLTNTLHDAGQNV